MTTLAKRQKVALRELDEAKLTYRWMRVVAVVWVVVWMGVFAFFSVDLVMFMTTPKPPEGASAGLLMLLIPLTIAGCGGVAWADTKLFPAYRRRRTALYAYQDVLDESLDAS